MFEIPAARRASRSTVSRSVMKVLNGNYENALKSAIFSTEPATRQLYIVYRNSSNRGALSNRVRK